MATDTKPDTVVLIHGLYLSHSSWEGWVARFEARGMKVLAPGWPGMEGTVEELRRNPAPIAQMQVETILDHYERTIRDLDTPPIIIGHSFGGAFTQVLLSRGVGAVGVGIAPASVRGIRKVPFVTLKSNFSLIRNPFARKKAIMLTEEQFRFGFTNTFPPDAAREAYERYAVPGSRNVLYSGVNAQLNPKTALQVEWGKPDRAPFLFVAGGQDHVVPASVNRANYDKYVKSNSDTVTAYKEYPSRSHFTAAEPGWEEVADFALDWALAPVAGIIEGR
jgi:alpha-beta hydrolase superfamily lysophospholipase